MMNFENMKREAVERMNMLNMISNPIEEFELENKLNKSERGILFWLTEEEMKMVKEFEQEHEALVYHVILSNTNIGLMYSLLYVSSSDEEWEYDRDNIKNGLSFAYVINVDMPDCSEFGSIGIKPYLGGVLRTA